MQYGKLQIEKVYWTTKEVSELTGVPDYTLKYWESTVPYLQVPRNRAKKRAWRKQDIEFVKALKSMLDASSKNLDSEKNISPLYEIDKKSILDKAPQMDDSVSLPVIHSLEPLVDDSILLSPKKDCVVDKKECDAPRFNAQTCKNTDCTAQNTSKTSEFLNETSPSSVDKKIVLQNQCSDISQANQHKPNPEVLRKLRSELLEAMAKLKG